MPNASYCVVRFDLYLVDIETLSCPSYFCFLMGDDRSTLPDSLGYLTDSLDDARAFADIMANRWSANGSYGYTVYPFPSGLDVSSMFGDAVPSPAGAGIDFSKPIYVPACEDLADYLGKLALKASEAAILYDISRPIFEVRAGLTGSNRDEWGVVSLHDSGESAAEWVKGARDSYAAAGKSLVIVKAEPAERQALAACDWRGRERQRLETGEYIPLPGDWAARIADLYPDHFAHVANSDKRKVAFTESESSGQRDKQKVLSAREYVNRYFVQNWLSDTQAAFCAAMIGQDIKPLFAPMGDVDAMVRVYRDCEDGDAHGCMSKDVRYYSSPIHPVSVYAMGGELTVALLRGDDDGEEIDTSANWDSAGPVLARCLVWPKGMQYGRVYGATENARILRTSLEALGYRAGSCSGARIAKVEHGGDYVMPYLDIGGGYVTECGDYWEAGGSDYQANRTDGFLDCPAYYCDCCGGRVSGTYSVRTSRHDYEERCGSCLGETTYCIRSGDRVPHSEAVEYILSGGRYSDAVARWYIDDGDIAGVFNSDGVFLEDGFTCADCGEAFRPSELNADGLDADAELCGNCLEDREAERAAQAEAEAGEAVGTIAA